MCSPLARHWSIYTVNNTEIVPAFILNAHHAVHIIYGSDDEKRLFALVTFKEAKRLKQVYELFGTQIIAEPQPRPHSNRLKDTSPFGIINTNINFMRSNFKSTAEIFWTQSFCPATMKKTRKTKKDNVEVKSRKRIKGIKSKLLYELHDAIFNHGGYTRGKYFKYYWRGWESSETFEEFLDKHESRNHDALIYCWEKLLWRPSVSGDRVERVILKPLPK